MQYQPHLTVRPTTRPKLLLLAGDLVIGEAFFTDVDTVLLYWYKRGDDRTTEVEIVDHSAFLFRIEQSGITTIEPLPVDSPWTADSIRRCVKEYRLEAVGHEWRVVRRSPISRTFGNLEVRFEPAVVKVGKMVGDRFLYRVVTYFDIADSVNRGEEITVTPENADNG